jgi:iron complex transport system substrate-binding protein
VKIVSLLPAATEIVASLGLADCLVGRSHECDCPEDVLELPALTRSRLDTSLPSDALDRAVKRIVEERLPIYELDETALAELRPDVVVTQEACEVCAIAKEQVVGTLCRIASDAQVVSLLPTRLEHIFEDVERVAEACGVGERGRRCAAGLRARVEAVRRARPVGRPRVAVVEWLAPPMLAGHWVPESVEAAGGTPVGPAPGERSPYATWDEIRALRPDAVVVAACGFDLERTRRESLPHAEVLASLAPRVLLLDGNAYLNRPGPRIVDAIETLGAWLRHEPVPSERGVELQEKAPTIEA